MAGDIILDGINDTDGITPTFRSDSRVERRRSDGPGPPDTSDL
jgi:hypothetical protein